MPDQDPDRGKRLAEIVDQLRRANPELSEKQAAFGAMAISMAEELRQEGVEPEALQGLQEVFSPAVPYAARDAIHRAEMERMRARMTGEAVADAIKRKGARVAPTDAKQQGRSRDRLGALTPIGQRAIFFYLFKHPDFMPRGFSDAEKIKTFAVKNGLPGADKLNPKAAFGKLVQAAAEGRFFAPVTPQKK
jgi:hypothetical protein